MVIELRLACPLSADHRADAGATLANWMGPCPRGTHCPRKRPKSAAGCHTSLLVQDVSVGGQLPGVREHERLRLGWDVPPGPHYWCHSACLHSGCFALWVRPLFRVEPERGFVLPAASHQLQVPGPSLASPGLSFLICEIGQQSQQYRTFRGKITRQSSCRRIWQSKFLFLFEIFSFYLFCV